MIQPSAEPHYHICDKAYHICDKVGQIRFSTRTQGETINQYQWMNQRTNQGAAGNETRNGSMDERMNE